MKVIIVLKKDEKIEKRKRILLIKLGVGMRIKDCIDRLGLKEGRLERIGKIEDIIEREEDKMEVLERMKVLGERLNRRLNKIVGIERLRIVEDLEKEIENEGKREGLEERKERIGEGGKKIG